MPRRPLRLSLFISLTFLVPVPGWATPIDATSHVTAATVFTDRALVTREAKVHVPAGAQTISITDMPAGFDESSIRVQGKAAAAVKIGTVEVKHIFLTDQANAAERDKNAALEAKNDEKAELDGEIAALRAREDFITRVVNGGPNNHEKDGLAKLDFAPDKWVQAWTAIQNGMMETEKALVAKNVAMRKLDEDINKLQQELNQIRSTGSKQQRNVQINVDAAQDTDLDLFLTYQTSGASWRPVYDARLDTATAALDLEQYGQVMQVTGEDWNDIDLTFSTAQPAAGSEMPQLAEWWVRLFQPVMQQAVLARAEFSAMGGAAKKSYLANKPAAAAIDAAALNGAMSEPEAKQKDAELTQTVAQTTEYAAEFRVPGHASLKSVRDPSKMFIGTVHMKAALEAKVTPRLAPQAFLFAKITNGESFPLIPGTVAKYRDGSFIGNAPLALLRPGEKADLSFGVDDRIKVTYQRIHEEQINPALIVIGDMKVERQYQTKVENLHKDPIAITVFEQYPVSADPDVKVELLDDVTTPGHAEDPEKRQGVIEWSGTYAPKDEKTFVLGFRVKYPKDRQISGL